MKNKSEVTLKNLSRYLTPLNVWALSFGCIIGWSAFVMPTLNFLPTAGPVGTALSMAIIAAILLVIAANYHYLINKFPTAGGAFTYTKKIFGKDHAFICACFLWFAYLNLLWSNASAFALIGRNFFGNVFKFGFSCNLAGHEIYFGELILTLVILFCAGIFCMRGKFLTFKLNTTLALILLIGGITCAVASIFAGGDFEKFSPPFVAEISPVTQIMGIFALTPFAFMGFECVSNAAGEFNFSPKKSLSIMAAAIIFGAIFYTAMTFLTLAHIPIGYSSWIEYVQHLSDWTGSAAAPIFYAANETSGGIGTALLSLSVIAAILSSIIGFYFVTSRLMFVMARENLLPKRFSFLNAFNVPGNAIVFVMLLSLAASIVGQVIIGWLREVTTISAAVVYGYVSAGTFLTARSARQGGYMLSGAAGVFISLAFLAMLAVQNFSAATLLSTESAVVLILLFALFIIFNVYSIMKRRELDAETAKSDADQIIVSKSNFLSKMLNNVNAPVTEIVGFTNLAMREDTPPEKMRDFMEMIKKSGIYLQSLIDDVMVMNELESGEVKLVETNEDLFQILNNARDKFAAQMDEKNITFAVEFSNVRNNFVRCDKDKLNKVLDNLIGNAYKFTSIGGKVTITLKQLGSEIENIGNYELSVRDSGTGMTPEFAQKVFEPFEREENPSILVKSAGLGMTIAKDIVELMHGKISVFTKKGDGTEFVINVKLAFSDN